MRVSEFGTPKPVPSSVPLKHILPVYWQFNTSTRFSPIAPAVPSSKLTYPIRLYSGKMMVTGASNGELFVWDVDTWEVTDILEGHSMGVLDVQINDKWIVSCSKDTSIRVWKRNTKEAYRVLQGHRGPVNAIQLYGDKICSASGDSLAKLWNIESGQIVRVFKGHERGLACVQ